MIDGSLSPNERFLTYACTRQYPNTPSRLVAVHLAASCWQESTDGRSGLVDVNPLAVARATGLSPMWTLLGLSGLRFCGVLAHAGPAVNGLQPCRLDLDRLPDCSSAGGGTYPVPDCLREWGTQTESDVYGFGDH